MPRNCKNENIYTKIREKDPKVKICFLTAGEMFYEEFRKVTPQFGSRIIGEECFIQKPIKNEDLIKQLTWIMDKNEDDSIIELFHHINNKSFAICTFNTIVYNSILTE